MLVERPFMREYVYTQQGSYVRHQKQSELEFAMEKLKQFPQQNFQKYREARFNSHMACVSTKPISYLNSRVSEGATYRKNNESKTPVHKKISKIKQEIAAFGPKHAEHARRVYQSKRTQPLQEFMQTYPPNYDPKQVSRQGRSQVTKESYLPREQVPDRSVNHTALYTDSLKGRVPFPVKYKPNESVLKVAKITPRPNKNQPMRTTGLYHKVEHGLAKKSVVFQDSGCELDLSNAPIFQILCAI